MKNVLVGIPLVVAAFLLDGRSKKPAVQESQEDDKKQGTWFQLGAIARWVKDNPWFFSVCVTVILALKVLRSVHGDVGTAAYMLAQGGVGIVLSVIVVSLPLLTAGAYLGAWAGLTSTYTERKWRQDQRVRGGWLFVGLMALTTLIVSGWQILLLVTIGSAVGTGLAVALMKKKPERIEQHPTMGQYVVFGLVGASLALGVSIISDRHWMPAESLTISEEASGGSHADQGSHVVTGYVIADNGVYVTYVDEADRTLHHVANADLEARQACALPDQPLFPREIPILALDAPNTAPLPNCNRLMAQDLAKKVL